MPSAEKHLLAGTGRRCINPPPNIAHGGWGAQKHEQAEGLDMDLWATALALSDGATTAVVLDIDIQILTNERADQIRTAVSKATGIPIQNVRASATHTHSGPVPYKSWIEKGYEMVGPWFENLARWAAEAASEAVANLRPAEVRAGRGDCHINSNRRCVTPSGERFLGVNPDGPCDHEVLVVRFDPSTEAASDTRPTPHPVFDHPLPLREAEGRGEGAISETGNAAAHLFDAAPLATLVNYACHGTIMGPANRLITPDFPGPMKRVVEDALGGRCLFLQGSAGDQGPVQGFQADTKVYRDLGSVLGHEVAKVALGLKAIPPQPKFREVVPSGAPLGMYDAEFLPMRGTPMRVLDKEIFVPLREGLPERKTAADKLEFWQAKLRVAREQATGPHPSPLHSLLPSPLTPLPSDGRGEPADGRGRVADAEAAITEAIYMARRADIQLRMAEDFGGKTSAGVRTHFIAFGDVALVGCNIEPFCEIGMAVKRASPFPVTFMCGYTNGRMAYLPTSDEWTKGGYEVENSPFGPNAAKVLQKEILQTLAELYEDAN